MSSNVKIAKELIRIAKELISKVKNRGGYSWCSESFENYSPDKLTSFIINFTYTPHNDIDINGTSHISDLEHVCNEIKKIDNVVSVSDIKCHSKEFFSVTVNIDELSTEENLVNPSDKSRTVLKNIHTILLNNGMCEDEKFGW